MVYIENIIKSSVTKSQKPMDFCQLCDVDDPETRVKQVVYETVKAVKNFGCFI